MHELVFFCLEYFDKLSSVLQADSGKALNFDFRRDIVRSVPSLNARLKESLDTEISVNDFWHSEWLGKDELVRKYLHNHDWFYRGRKDKTDKNGGRYKFWADRDWNKRFRTKLQNIRNERWNLIDLIRGKLLWKEGVLKDSLDQLRIDEISKASLKKWCDLKELRYWYCWNWNPTEAREEAQYDNIVGFISYIRDDIYKKIYDYSDRKSADGMDAFLRLTTVLDRIDWKIHVKNYGKEDYPELFLGLEDDFIYLLAMAVELYSIDEMSLESYAAYEKLLLAPEKS